MFLPMPCSRESDALGRRRRTVKLWAWLTRSKYTLYLEKEINRLREENRQLLNTVLKANGLPTMPSTKPPEPMPKMRTRMLPSQWKARFEHLTAKEKPNGN